MQHFRAKRIQRDNEKSKNSWSPSAEDEKLRHLELLIDEKLSQRYQRWCRACVSEHCCMEEPLKETRSVIDEDHATHFQTIRNKRVDFEKCIDRVDKLVSSCRYGILHARGQPTCDDQLPIWLYEVLGVGLKLPLVPTFPTSASAFENLCSRAGLRDLNSQLREEYLRAASCARRLVVIGGAKLKYRQTNATQVLIKEEISQGYHRMDDVLMQKSPSESREQSKNDLETTAKILSKIDDVSENFHGVILQKLENQMQWTGAFYCAHAEIKECGRERALIVGQLSRSHLKGSTGEPSRLPFKAILLLDERRDGKMRVKGTFLRKSACSSFDLRWKFNVVVA